ncbi:T9SS type A sorting domain-containing protein [bacterium]|nr:T9SS type A sorting domain-containing protein [bacterium]
MKKVIFLIFVASLCVLARTPEEKSGTYAIMKAFKEGRISSISTYEIMRPSLPHSFDTPEGHFKIHYDLSGYNAVDSVGYVYKIGRYLEDSWSFYMDSLGYIPPPSDGTEGGDGKYDIYLRDLDCYGQTWPGDDGPQPWSDWTSYIDIENDFDGVYPNDDPEGPVAGAMKITCAHEFHHAVQFGLRGTSGAWIAELTSVYYEERCYPMVNDYIWLIEYLTSNPEQPLDWEAGYHMYGLGLFSQHIANEFTDGFLTHVWDTMRYLEDWDALVATSYLFSTSLEELYSEFATLSLLIGSRDAGYFADGPAFADMRIENTHNSYPTGGSTSNRPYGFGANYIEFTDFPIEDIDLTISFHGEASTNWFVNGVWKSGDSSFVIEGVCWDTAGTIVIPLVNRADFVGLSVIPTGDTRVRYIYSYTADVGATRIDEREFPNMVSIKISPNPFNSICVIEANANEIEIYDNTGKSINSMILKNGRTSWDARDNEGSPVPSGIYFIKTEGSLAHRVAFIK